MQLKKLFSSTTTLSLIILCLFLATNRYTYGWDDQALEIPLLKHLIDAELYQGDYYVESLKTNFSSFLYPLLAKFITVDQVKGTYFVLYLISRFFLFFFSLKLFTFIGKSKQTGFLCTLAFFLIGRTEEFLYRTFSHQELSLAIIVGGIYYFYRDRHILAALLLGLAANFNGIYALYPFIYLWIYILIFVRQQKIKKLLLTGCTFGLAASPFIYWTLTNIIHSHQATDPSLTQGWQALFFETCPQNYLFAKVPLERVFSSFAQFLESTTPYLYLIFGFTFLNIFSKDFRQDKKTQTLCVTAFLLLVVSFLFSYTFPSKFFINLNLIRNAQFIQFFIMSYFIIWGMKALEEEKGTQIIWVGLVIAFMSIKSWITLVILFVATIILLLKKYIGEDYKSSRQIPQILMNLVEIAIVGSLIYFWIQKNISGSKLEMIGNCFIGLCILFILLVIWPKEKRPLLLKRFAIYIPIIALCVYFCLLHYKFVLVTTQGGGFWQAQRNWENMQEYVKEKTPTDAIILVPYDMEMGGFRIGSEREIVVSYRDSGIVGFDLKAMREWQQRIHDIKDFKVMSKGNIQSAVINGIRKYNADYIVFMKYYAPRESSQILQKIYENEVFTLHQVMRK